MLRLLIFSSIISLVLPCVPTTTVATTTTTACCPILSSTTLPRRTAPTGQEQCSILHRVSSTCPVDGFVMCEAAPDTNPTTMFITFFNAAGATVRSVSVTGTKLVVKVICVGGSFFVKDATGTTNLAIASVSCAQTGSTGLDNGYVANSAVN